jgi:hypothetical protein
MPDTNQPRTVNDPIPEALEEIDRDMDYWTNQFA